MTRPFSEQRDTSCGMQEDFLFGILDENRSAQFRQHCLECMECAEAVAAEKRMKSRLQAAVNSTVPQRQSPASVDRGARRADARRSNRRSRSAGIAVAIGMLSLSVLVSFVGRLPPTGNESAGSIVAEAGNATTAIPVQTVRPPRVELDNNLLGLSLDSGDPNVVVVLVYPIHRPVTPKADTLNNAVSDPLPLIKEFH